jgi:hypothetical protein
MVFAARIITDPQQDYLNAKVNKLTRDDYIYTLTVDLNEDGVEDIFYSSSAKEDVASRRGAKTWVPYLSTPQDYQVADIGDVVSKTQQLMTLNTTTASLQ